MLEQNRTYIMATNVVDYYQIHISCTSNTLSFSNFRSSQNWSIQTSQDWSLEKNGMNKKAALIISNGYYGSIER